MENQEDSSQQSLFYRFARLKAIREEERRTKEQNSLRPLANTAESDKYYETWRTKEEKKAWDDQQFEYMHKHVAEYMADTSITNTVEQQTDKLDDSILNGHSNGTDSQKDESCPDLNILGRYNSWRGRKRASRALSNSSDRSIISASTARPPTPPPSTNVDFERTSTIMPPTEHPPNAANRSVDLNELRAMYFNNHRPNNTLPIYKERNTIIDSINSYSVVIIEGITGCGKTTQVPVYILEDAVLNKKGNRSPVIYVTQPRRIAARSIAERICSEHGWTLGSIVGYQVSLEKVVGPQTVLVFCTAGVLLQKIIQEKSLRNYTHIIIDEAHERDADTDLLMMMIRKLMLQEMSLFRLVVMSATMDIAKLKKYFTFKTKHGHQPLISPSFIRASDSSTPSNISITYFDKLQQSFNIDVEDLVFDPAEPDLKDGCLDAAVELIIRIIPKFDNYSEESKSTLVFLPGLAEISRLHYKLKEHDLHNEGLDIFPLHSCLTVSDQLRIFKKSQPGYRKVILATNIAESSITLPDVGFIVDFCLTKTLMKDNLTRFPTLKVLWATQDKCTQRAGRTGRCCTGRVFRMVPQDFYRSFRPYAEPELLTSPLELSALRVKNFGMGEIAALLAIVLDPPPYKEIRTAVLELKQIGALAATHRGELSDIDGDITELGRIISVLPIDVRLSKLIVIASVFDVLEDAVIVAACLSTNRTVIRYLYGDDEVHLDNYDTRLTRSQGSESDLMVSLACYKEFHQLKTDRGKGDKWLASWCERNHLDERKLHDVDSMVTEILERLKQVNICHDIEMPNLERDLNVDYLMLKLAFCAAFYPNYFLAEKLDADRIEKELGGLDPTRTVIINNIPVNHAPLYKTQITRQIENRLDLHMEYISDCSRALILLQDNDNMSSQGAEKISKALDETNHKVQQQRRGIPKSMYLALKMADFVGCTPLEIREYQERAAIERMDYYNQMRDRLRQLLAPKIMPTRAMIVDDRPADNSRLLEATTDEYTQMMNDGGFYYEVELNHEQDEMDKEQLFELEEQEKRTRLEIHNNTFKPGYKRIRGPTSPIRMSFRSVLVKSLGYSVEIDHQSVNCILLDPDYRKDRRQMLVAASVTQSNKGKVMARDTTLMPNIRGLPTLIALLFAQYYRLIYNEKMNCIAGGIFGIGWDAADEPTDRNYEVILGFDVHLTPNDMALVNEARRIISELLKFTEISNVGKPQALLQANLRNIIITLMRQRRYPLQESDVSMIYYQSEAEVEENLFIKDIHNLPSDMIEEGQTRPFLPLAKFTREYKELAMYFSVRENLDQLKRIEDAEESVPRGGIHCLLCGNGQTCCFVLCGSLLAHLSSADHLDRKSQFESFEILALSRAEQP